MQTTNSRPFLPRLFQCVELNIRTSVDVEEYSSTLCKKTGEESSFTG